MDMIDDEVVWWCSNVLTGNVARTVIAHDLPGLASSQVVSRLGIYKPVLISLFCL